MCSMCHYCGSGRTESKDGNKKQGNESSYKLSGRVPFMPCKFCGETLERQNVKWDSASPCVTPLISPITSLSSTDSCVATCSEFSVNLNLTDSRCQEGALDGGMEDLDNRLSERACNSSLKSSEHWIENSSTVMENNAQESNNNHEGYTVRDVKIAQGPDCQEAKADGSENSTASFGEEIHYSLPDDLDLQTWEPPEPEDPQDDMENHVACNDDDEDEGMDSVNWFEPTSLNFSKDEVSGSYMFKEEKQRAMEEVKNGKFRALVGQLLKSVDVSSSDESGESWVDIVTSLSWDAASFLKLVAIGADAMNPDGYVKVKCIATGSRSQSQVVKGLVFKKHASHKHMPTKYKNPRLLLISGMLGNCSSGLSSFAAMEQEKSHLKSLIELIERFHPNVILVEKTVSCDLRELILSKGMTLVLDMKLHRLERIACCTGSPILSSDNLNGQKLKNCDLIYFEKFVEELAGFAEGGKRPINTLMFIEGCPTRLGCTILLKGAHSDELKRIKCVVRCAVVMAYHLILETSFLVDQKAMFSTIPVANVASILPTKQQVYNSAPNDSSVSSLEYPSAENQPISTEIPISRGFNNGSTNGLNFDSEELSPFSYEPYNPAIFSGFSAISSSLKKVIGDSFPFASSAPCQSLSAYFGCNGKEPDGQLNRSISVIGSPEADDKSKTEDKIYSDEEKSLDGGQNQSLPVCLESNWDKNKEADHLGNQTQSIDGINAVLDSQSILVLMSSRNALQGTICQQSHFSHIMFYKNFDVPLGKFLQDNLLNQTRLCDSCHQLPEAHFYCYAHRNKQLTILVKQLPQEKCLPGEAEGKLWMWSHCGKCKSGSTKRVLISTTACSLSFGNFLELSLSHYSCNRKSSCGHSPDWDFLYFFGLGHMVARFRYSTVTSYTVSMPPQKLDFSGAIRQEWLLKETEDVYMKGILLFTEVTNFFNTIKVRFDGSTLNVGGSIREFLEVEEMLKQERDEFEVNIKNAVAKNGNPDQAAYKLLSLNRLMWDLLIESCVWDQRLCSLLSHDCLRVDSHVAEQGTSGRETYSVGKIVNMDIANGSADMNLLSDTSVEANASLMKEIPTSGHLPESNDKDNTSSFPLKDQILAVNDLGYERASNQELDLRLDVSTGNFQPMDFVMPNHHVYEKCPVSTDIQNSHSISDLKVYNKNASLHSPVSNLQDSNECFWKPFDVIRQVGIRELQKRYLPKFEPVSSSIAEYLPTAHQLITEEGMRLHIPLKTDNYIVSDYDGELSSIIACALAMLRDSSVVTEVDDADSKRESEIPSKATESLHGLNNTTVTSLPTFSSNNLDSDSVHSTGSISSEESQPESHSIEIALGHAKSLGKEKYSVVCPYVNKFHELRNWCCPSEVDYIASLSRCRNWDAKGGKSKSFFAKTLDGRFIIKEIKKTELDSFLGFAPVYFKYMKESLQTGSQTCLAKVLGIYQVTKRNTKTGKEVKHDVMVMENLTYGRNITRQYDLKGALYARYNSAVDGAGDVLLDQNFVNDMNSSPLYVSNKAKRLLHRAVWNDTTFLNSVNVMDYSLLVGVDSQRRELVCGIIDYLRQYTWDKHLETWMKTSLVVPKNVLPTVISPREYKKRFRKFMSTHFLSVPDRWCLKKSTDPCRPCGSGEDDSSQQNS